MFFLARCIFWLTVVFTSLPWPEETRGLMSNAPQNMREKLGGILPHTTEKSLQDLKSACASKPQACLQSAAELRAFSDWMASSNR
jgi:hypothetical protein